MACEVKHGLLIGFRRLSTALLVMPLTAVAGGCVIQDPTPPQPAGPVVIDRYCPPTRYVYCDERYMCDAGGYRHYERNNVTIINRTTNITNITYVDNRVINRGVDVRHVEERSGRRVEWHSG